MAEQAQARTPADDAKSEIARRIADRIDEIYTRGTVIGDDGNFYERRPKSVPRHVGEFIASIVRSERPRATLEIGMAWGLSTLFILQALMENGDKSRPHVVADPFQAEFFHNAALRSLRELGISEMVEFHQEPSEFLLPRLAQQQRQFDLAFIDGYHRFENVFVEMRFVHTLLKPGGVVIFDDSNWDAVHLTCRFVETTWNYIPVGEVGQSEDRSSDHQPGEFGSPWRPRANAYRKPMQEHSLPEKSLAPFFSNFLPAGLLENMLQKSARQLRHDGHAALRAGDRTLARTYLKLALRSDPTHFKSYLRLVRTYLPWRLSSRLGGGMRTAGR